MKTKENFVTESKKFIFFHRKYFFKFSFYNRTLLLEIVTHIMRFIPPKDLFKLKEGQHFSDNIKKNATIN
jgi:hypothetical protein